MMLATTPDNIKSNNDKNYLFDKNSKIINLTIGAPGIDLLSSCCDIFETATQHRMKFERENNSYLFQYGPSSGNDEYREQLAKFLSNGYKDKVNRDDLVFTCGATQGLHLILSTILDLSAFIFVDEVTYLYALDCFALYPSMKIRTIPLKADGVDTEYLENQLKETKFNSENKLFWGVYYTIPTHHNPTGILFSKETNERLIKLARKYDILITCDDVYNLLNYTDDLPPKRLFAYDNASDEDYKGHVISNGTFTKILSPGIRLGWMEFPPRFADLFLNTGILKGSGAANHYISGIVASLMELGLAEKQLNLYKKKYGERLKAVCEVLHEKLSKKCKFNVPTGGNFIWITFPSTVDCTDFNQYCKTNYGISAITGDNFSATGSHKNCMRLTFAFHEEAILRESITKLCLAFDSYYSR